MAQDIFPLRFPLDVTYEGPGELVLQLDQATRWTPGDVRAFHAQEFGQLLYGPDREHSYWFSWGDDDLIEEQCRALLGRVATALQTEERYTQVILGLTPKRIPRAALRHEGMPYVKALLDVGGLNEVARSAVLNEGATPIESLVRLLVDSTASERQIEHEVDQDALKEACEAAAKPLHQLLDSVDLSPITVGLVESIVAQLEALPGLSGAEELAGRRNFFSMVREAFRNVVERGVTGEITAFVIDRLAEAMEGLDAVIATLP